MGLQPRVFHYSLDWRFLLPIADAKNIYLLLEENEDFSQTLAQVGIDISQHVAFSDLRQNKSNEIESFVIPFGMPSGRVSSKREDQIQFYSSVRRLIAPIRREGTMITSVRRESRSKMSGRPIAL